MPLHVPSWRVRAMLAIGRRGQIGLNGRLPWEGDTSEVFQKDVRRFFAMTRGHVLIAGPRIFSSVPDVTRRDRDVVEIRSDQEPAEVIARFPGRTVFVGGGPAMWTAYAPLIGNWDITRLPYDGEADRWFDPGWLVSGTARVHARCRDIESEDPMTNEDARDVASKVPRPDLNSWTENDPPKPKKARKPRSTKEGGFGSRSGALDQAEERAEKSSSVEESADADSDDKSDPDNRRD